MKADLCALISKCQYNSRARRSLAASRINPPPPPHHLPPCSISCHCSSHPPLFCFLCNFTSPSPAFYVPSKEESFKPVGSPVGVLNPNEVAVSSSGSRLSSAACCHGRRGRSQKATQRFSSKSKVQCRITLSLFMTNKRLS